MASILTIPLELLVSISSHLPTSDLAALRQTCTHVETSLYEWFSGEFFTKKQFMLTQPSLQALIDISNHASLSKKLKHIILATNLYDINAQVFRDRDTALRYFEGLEDQRSLLCTGFGRDMLTEAFQNLPHLETVGIRNFNASNRTRDNGSWGSWGASTVFRDTGINLQVDQYGNSRLVRPLRPSLPPDNIDFVSRVFSTLLLALGKANCTPSQLEILLRHGGLLDTSLHIPDFLRPGLERVLQNISSLLLTIEFAAPYVCFSAFAAPQTFQSNSLHRFLTYTPNLTHLRLNFMSSTALNIESFLEWLGRPISSSRQTSTSTSSFDVAPIPLRTLKRLDLGQVGTQRVDLLLTIIAKLAPTLVELNLWKMSLFNRQHTMNDTPNLWKDFIIRLSKVPNLNLTHLMLGMLKQEHHYVQFKDGDDGNARKLKERAYSGQEMDKFMNELIEQVFVCWPEPVPEVDVSADEDEDEEMEDEDDYSEDEEDDEEDEE